MDPDEPEVSEDPVLKRLFPSAYPNDPAAASDFRRFTERDLRVQKVAEAQVVLDRLEATALGAHDLKIPRDETDAWLRTLTSVRLAVATRLGISDAVSRRSSWPSCPRTTRGRSWSASTTGWGSPRRRWSTRCERRDAPRWRSMR